MLFKKLAVGTLGLWWNGNLPQNLLQMWGQRNGFNPVSVSIAACLGTIVAIPMLLSILLFSMVDTRLSGRMLVCAFVFLIAGCVVGACNDIYFGAGPEKTFLSNLRRVEGYVGLSIQDIGALSREGLRYHAQENLKEAGVKLRNTQVRLNPYHTDAEKLRTDFEKRYATFLAFAMIEDEGYGSFIPPM